MSVRLAVKVLIVDPRGQVPLLKRRVAPAAVWDLPGGTVEPDEAPEEAVRRELLEELGLADITDLSFAGAHWLKQAHPRTFTMIYAARLAAEIQNREPSRHSELKRNLPAVWLASESELSESARYALDRSIWTDVVAPPARARKVDILLLQPFFPLADREAASIPLGLAYIAAVLERSGYSVAVLDCTIGPDYSLFMSQLGRFDPAVVGVQFHSAMSWDFCLRACSRIRREVPGAYLVAGGEIASTRSQQLLDRSAVDTIVRQEGEYAFLELVRSVLTPEREAAHASIPEIDPQPDATSAVGASAEERPVVVEHAVITDLDELPPHSIDLFRWKEYGQWSLMTSRGCPFRCTYCSSAAFWRHTIRYHSAARIYEDMERLMSYGATSVYIADDTFTLSRERVRALCSRLIDRPLIDWSCLTRVDCVDMALLTMMASAGCRQISFGFETSNDDTLKVVRKRSRYERARTALADCHRAGIRTRVSVIVGLPGETGRDVDATLDALLDVRPNEVQLYGLTPHDGTALVGEAEMMAVRVLEPDPLLWSRDVLRPVCETDALGADEIAALGRRMIDTLVASGYVYLNEIDGKRKIGASYTVGTAFTPVQAIGGV